MRKTRRFAAEIVLLAFLIGFQILIITVREAGATVTIQNGNIIEHTYWGPGAGAYGFSQYDDSELIIAEDIIVGGLINDEGVITLTVLPGTAVRFQSGIKMTVGSSAIWPGKLVAEGEPDNEIYFTSSANSPAPGDWKGIQMTQYADRGCVIQYSVIEYAGGSNVPALKINVSSVTEGQPIISVNKIRYNLDRGIEAIGPGTGSNIVRARISDNIFDGNSLAIFCQNAQPIIEFNDLLNNSENDDNIAILNSSYETLCVTAENNWWGDNSGPLDPSDPNVDCGSWTNPGGLGQGVSDGVDYAPWMDRSITYLRPPTALLPIDGAIIFDTLQPLLTVANSFNSTESAVYDFEVYRGSVHPDNYASGGTVNQTVTTTSWQVNVELQQLAPAYTWRARVRNGAETSVWSSSTPSFTIDLDDLPSDFDLSSPLDQSTVSVLPQEFSWQSAENDDLGDQVRYTFHWDTDSGFGSGFSVTEIETPLYQMQGSLTEDTIYYWKVEAYDTRGNEKVSSVWEFALNQANNLPSEPLPVSPTPGASLTGVQADLVITNSTDSDVYPQTLTYLFEVAGFDDIEFDNPIASQDLVAQGAQGVTSWLTPELPEQAIYYWRVRAHDGISPGNWMDPVRSFITGDAPLNSPPEPVDSGFDPVDGSVISDQTPVISWDPAVDPDEDDPPETLRYRLEYTLNPSWNSVIYPITTAAGISQASIVTPLTDNEIWYYRIIAIDDSDAESDPSETQSFCVDMVSESPSAPILNSPADGSVASGSTLLQWSESVDPDCGSQITYLIEVSPSIDFQPPSASETAVISVNSTALQSLEFYSQLVDDQTYYWRVLAQDLTGNDSPYSQTWSFCLDKANDAPETVSSGFSPTGNICIDSNTPSIAWFPSDDPDCGHDPDDLSYEIELADNNGFTVNDNTRLIETAAGATAVTVSPALSDRQWFYRIQAVDPLDAESGWSATQSFVLDASNQNPPAPDLIFPSDDGVIMGNQSFDWSDVTDPDPCDAIASYTLQILDLTNLLICEELPVSGSSFPINQLSCYNQLAHEGQYRWQVQAVDQRGGTSGFGQYRSFILERTEAPGAPISLTPADNSVVATAHPTLCVQNSIDPNVPPEVLIYEFQVSVNIDFSPIFFTDDVDQTVTSTCVTVSANLDENGIYFWRARAKVSSSPGTTSEWSDAFSFCVNAVNSNPSLPANLTPSNGEVAGLQSQLCWTESTDLDCGDDPIMYHIWIDDSAGFDSPEVDQVDVAATCITLSDYQNQLADDTVYYWKVQANDSQGGASGETDGQAYFCYDEANSAPNPVVSGFDPANDVVIAELTPTISWNPADDPDCGASPNALHYLVEWGTNGVSFPNTGETENGVAQFAMPAPLQENSHLFYRIQTLDYQDGSEYSETQSFWIDAQAEPPSAPTGFQPNNGDLLPPQGTFSWTASVDPDPIAVISYTLVIAIDENFNNIVSNNLNIGANSFHAEDLQNASFLVHNMVYYYQVIATDDDGLTAVGETATFTFNDNDAPQDFHLLSPVNGSILSGYRPQLDWEDAQDPSRDIVGYILYFSLNSDFSQADSVTNIPDSNYNFDFDLSQDVAYYWFVYAIDTYNARTRSVESWQFRIVSNSAPEPFHLLSPANQSILPGTRPHIDWEDAQDDGETLVYKLQYARNSIFDPYILIEDIFESHYDFDTDLEVGRAYYWRVFAVDEGGETTQSIETWRFEIDLPPETFHLLSPEDGAILNTARPALDWEDASDVSREIASYGLRYSSDPDMATYVEVPYIEPSLFIFDQDLTEHETYYWQVFARDDREQITLSQERWSFTIDAADSAPIGFDLISPIHDSVVDNVLFQWSESSDPDPSDTIYYRLAVATDADFVSPLIDIYGLTDPTYLPQDLPDDLDYFWSVVAYGSDDPQHLDGIVTVGTPEVSRFHLNRQNNPPNPVVSGFSPANGMGTDDSSPLISWNPATDPDIDDTPETLRYRFELGTNFNNPLVSLSTNPGQTQAQIPIQLATGIWYYRILTLDDENEISIWSETQFFEVVSAACPSSPTIFEPIHNSVVTDRTPNLIVQNAIDGNQPPLALTYQFQISTMSNFSSISDQAQINEGNGGVTAWTIGQSLADNTIYYWRVQADNGLCSGDWDQASFCLNTVNDNPSDPILTSPEDGAEAVNNTLLDWNDSDDPDCFDQVEYLLEIAEDFSFFDNPLITQTDIASSNIRLQQVQGYEVLQDDATYFWRVRTLDQNSGMSNYSDHRSFCLNIENDPPDPVTQGFTPANGDCISDNTPTISWDPAQDNDCEYHPETLAYEVWLDNNSAMSSPEVFNVSAGATSFTVTVPLSDGQWFYRIQTIDFPGDRSGWSDVQSFTLDSNNAPPTRPDLISPEHGDTLISGDSFIWSESHDPDPCGSQTITYTLQILSANMNSICTEEALSGTSFMVHALSCFDDLVNNLTYRWRVLARDGSGTPSNYSDNRAFIFKSIDAEPPTTPVLDTPVGEVATLHPRLCLLNGVDPNDPPLPLTYEYQVSTNENFSDTVFQMAGVDQIAGFTCTLVTIELQENSSYFWRARSHNGVLYSAWSQGLYFCVNSVNENPSPPAGLTPAFNPENIPEATPQTQLCWNASSDPDCNNDSIVYQLQIDDDPAFGSPDPNIHDLTQTCVNLSDYADQLTDDRTYYWRVHAVDNHDLSSGWADARFCYNYANSSPNLVTTGFDPAGGEEVATRTPLIQWDASDDPDCSDSPANIQYRVEWGTDSGLFSNFQVTGFGQAQLVPDNPLTENAQWFYRVRAMDHEGAPSGYSETQDFWVNAVDQPPSSPENLQPDNGAETRIQDYFTWSPSVDPDPFDTVSYTLEVAENDQFIDPISIHPDLDPAEFLVGDLENFDDLPEDQLLYWRVTAMDNDALYSISEAANFILQKVSPPDSPQIVCPPNGVEIEPEDILCWTASYDPDIDDIVRYALEFSLTDQFEPALLAVSDIVDTFYVIGDAAQYLDDDQVYYWRVYAVDSYDLTSMYSDETRWFIFNEENDPPNPVTEGFDPADGEEISDQSGLVIRWLTTDDPDSSDSVESLSYQVDLTSDPTFLTIDRVLETPPFVSYAGVGGGLIENTRYYYRVFAKDDDNTYSVPSEMQNFWINEVEEPPIISDDMYPADCEIELDETGQLCWLTAVDPDPNDGIDHYILQVDDQADFIGPLEINAVIDETIFDSCVTLGDLDGFANLEENSLYHWRVAAMDASEIQSDFTLAGCFTLNSENDPPNPVLSGFSPTNGDRIETSDVRFCWNAATDIDPGDPPETLRYRIILTKDGDIRERETSSPGDTCLVAAFDENGADDGIWQYRLVTIDDEGEPSVPSYAQSFELNVENDPPNPPDLIYPCGEIVTNTDQPTLTISPGYDPDSQELSYEFQIATTADFEEPIASGFTTDTTWIVPFSLDDQNCAPYYWRTRAIDEQGGSSDFSATCGFVINYLDEPPSEFALLSPENNDIVQTRRPLFDWTDSDDPDCEGDPLYDLYVSLSPDFPDHEDSTQAVQDLSESIYQPTANDFLPDNSRIYWRVVAVDADHDSTWSVQTWQFIVNVENEPPFPPDGLRVESDTLYWNPSRDPDPLDEIDHYDLRVSPDQNFNNILFTVHDLTETYLPIVEIIQELEQGGTYFFQVQAFDQSIASNWSDGAQFDALPVDLAFFTANSVGNEIRLAWETIHIGQVAGFHIQRKIVSSGVVDRPETPEGNIRLTENLLISGNGSFLYTDQSILPDQIYQYQLEEIDIFGQSFLHEPIVVRSLSFPAQTKLYQNYPNPCYSHSSNHTTIRFALSSDTPVTLKVYDIGGRLIKNLVDGEYPVGFYMVEWDGTNEQGREIGGGVYFYVLNADQIRLSKRMVLLK